MSSPKDFDIINGVLIKYVGPGGDVVIHPGVTAIGDQAFWDHRGKPITSITIPEGVTEIGHQALDGCTEITHVELPSSLRKIGSYAFSRWMSLRQITIPEGVEEIGHAAFHDCFGLSLIRLPASLKKIENVNIVFPDKRFVLVDAPEGSYAEAVAKQNNMPLVTKEMTVTPDFVCLEDELIKYLGTGGEVTIPDGITYVGNTAFRFSAVTGVKLPDSLQKIGQLAFDNCRELTSITIPEGVTEIRAKAFSDCYVLQSVDLPASLTVIGDKAFHSFYPPDRITVRAPKGSYGSQYAKANGMQYLDSSAVPVGDFIIEDGVLVKYTGSGGEAVIPDGVTAIGLAAFARCENLAAVTVPEGVTEIREKAFAQCYGLRTIHLPASLMSIGEAAFESNLANAGFPLGSPTVTVRAPKGSYAEQYVKEGNMLFLDRDAVPTGDFYLEGGRLLKYAGLGGEVSVPEGVTSIGYAAFAGCHALTSVTLPAGITELGWFAFADCENLTSINLPEGLTTIGTGAFFGCGQLEGIGFPESLEIIEDNAFGWCGKLEKVVLPDHLREIGQDALLLCIGGSFIGKRELPDIYARPTSKAAQAVRSAGLTFQPYLPSGVPASCPIEFKGKVFVLTAFDRERKELIKTLIEGQSGNIINSTTDNTDYLIYDERKEILTKNYLKAEEMKKAGRSIQIISGKQFLAWIDG